MLWCVRGGAEGFDGDPPFLLENGIHTVSLCYRGSCDSSVVIKFWGASLDS